MSTPTDPSGDGEDFDIAEQLTAWLAEQDRRRFRPTPAEIMEDVLAEDRGSTDDRR